MASLQQDKCTECSTNITEPHKDKSSKLKLCYECTEIHESSALSNDDIMQKVGECEPLNEIISTFLPNIDTNPWLVMEIHDAVYVEVGLNLSIERTDLFALLLTHFNKN